jgi:hypothetical protein
LGGYESSVLRVDCLLFGVFRSYLAQGFDKSTSNQCGRGRVQLLIDQPKVSALY